MISAGATGYSNKAFTTVSGLFLIHRISRFASGLGERQPPEARTVNAVIYLFITFIFSSFLYIRLQKPYPRRIAFSCQMQPVVGELTPQLACPGIGQRLPQVHVDGTVPRGNIFKPPVQMRYHTLAPHKVLITPEIIVDRHHRLHVKPGSR